MSEEELISLIKESDILRISLIYEARCYLSDKCGHCVPLFGLEFNGGFETLFMYKSPLGNILTEHGFRYENLYIVSDYHWQWDKYYLPIKRLGELKTLLTYKANPTYFSELKKMSSLIEQGVNLIKETIHFYNVSIKPHFLYRNFWKYTPVILTPCCRGGAEQGVSPDTEEIELKEMFFRSNKYRLQYHHKVKGKADSIWDYVLQRRIGDPMTSEEDKPY